MLRLWNKQSFKSTHRKKSGKLRSGNQAGQAISPKRDIAAAPPQWPRADMRTDNQYEMASSPLKFPLLTIIRPMTSYRVESTKFKFEICQLALHHSVFLDEVLKMVGTYWN